MRWLIPRLPEFQHDHPGTGIAHRQREHDGRTIPDGCRCRDLGPVTAARLGRDALSRRSPVAGAEPRPDEKMPAADTYRSRAAHVASCRDVARGMAALVGRRQCPRSQAGTRSGLRTFLFCDPGGARGAWGADGPIGADQR